MKKVSIYDFDDTLCKTSAHVYVTHGDGSQSALSPAAYAVYEPQPGDSFDYREFDQVLNPQPLKHIDYLRRCLAAGSATFVLTARGEYAPVKEYLKSQGITGVYVVALGSSNPNDKAQWILKQIEAGASEVYFADDSPKNVEAVRRVLATLPIRWHVEHVTE